MPDSVLSLPTIVIDAVIIPNDTPYRKFYEVIENVANNYSRARCLMDCAGASTATA
jgi:hypothetical protein